MSTPPEIRDIPRAVADALRAVHRLVVQRRPYAKVVAALDVAATLPEAVDPGVAELIALERREAQERYEVEGGPELHARVEGEKAAGAGETFSADFIEGIRYAFHHRKMGWPYEDVVAILDAVAELPSAAECPDQLSHDRIVVARWYERPDEDLEREIERALRTDTGPAWSRAGTIMLACDGRPALAERYMPALIAKAEEELRECPDPVVQKQLDGLERRLARTMAPTAANGTP